MSTETSANELETIDGDAFNEFLQRATKDKISPIISKMLPCRAIKKGKCPDRQSNHPDKDLYPPRCGLCEIARKDQQAMIEKISAEDFEHVSGPERSKMTHHVMRSELKRDGSVFRTNHTYGNTYLLRTNPQNL